MTRAQLEDLLVEILTGAAGGTAERWREILGPVTVYRLRRVPRRTGASKPAARLTRPRRLTWQSASFEPSILMGSGRSAAAGGIDRSAA
jgi:hypothetical protein